MKIYTNKKRGKHALSPFFITCYALYPDFNLEKPEEQEKQGDGQNDLECFFTEELLGPAAQHTAGKPADDDGDHQPHVGKVSVHQVTDKGADAGE